METNYRMPAIVWLKMTDYMHGWLQWELGGALRVKNWRVLSVQHLPGAREVLRGMESEGDRMGRCRVNNSMSATRRNCIDAGMDLDPDVTHELYGVTKEDLGSYLPVECPKMCMTRNGVVRPWTSDVNLGRRQSTALQHLLREAFWGAVEQYNREYAERMGGSEYPAVDMIEGFCEMTGTPDLHVEAMRREWQRRQKRQA